MLCKPGSEAIHSTGGTPNTFKRTSAVTTAIQTTQLGDKVTLDGAVTEGYYCVDAAGALQKAASV